MATDKQIIEGFWKEYVDGFIFHDLENAARPAEANFLVALGAMCYCDFFGKLMTGVQGSPTNFKLFVTTHMPRYAAIIDELYSEVRSGLVHAYFPKNVYTVGRVRDPASPGNAIWKENGRWKIAVVDFTKELKAAADSLKSSLLSGKYVREFKQVVLQDPGMDRIPVS